MAQPLRPSEGELEILKVLWAHGPCTVQQVHEIVGKARGTGYTTVLKVLQIMLAKALVRRDDSERQHVYAAAVTEKRIQRHLVRDFLDRVFSGSSQGLVMSALSAKKASPDELAQIRSLLDELEGGDES